MKTKFRLLFRYTKDRKSIILLIFFFSIVNLTIGFIYQLPLERALLSIAINGLVSLVVGFFDFIHFHKKHKKLSNLRHELIIGALDLPEKKQLVEGDYQIIILEMQKLFLKIENEFEQKEQEILDYFITWVHQIKVPIATLSLIVQEEDSQLSEEVEEQLFNINQYVNLIFPMW